MKVIAWFNELDKSSIGVAGGKGANLGVLTKAGLPVPPGFVVTAQAFKHFIETTGVDKEIYEILNQLDINDNEALQKASRQIKTIITSEQIPPEVKEEIIKAYDNMTVGGNRFEGVNERVKELVSATKPKELFVAVRSSATAEDLPEASFAGQQETFLNVKGNEDVLTAVRNCWASLYTPRAIFYREKNNFPHEKVLIAVIIQKMVDSEKSGVAFSVHPATGQEDEIVIEAGWGIGEYVVKGVINPDNYIVDKNTFQIKEKKIKRQTKMLTRDPLTGKNIEVEIPDQKQEKQVLDDEQVITLARVMKKIEDHYQFAQDVEWASENNRLFIVQSRPVTFFGKKEDKTTQAKPTGEVIISGLGASPGQASGKAVIIKDETELNKVQKGNILVTKMTDPDMVPAMERAAAIVTDDGGLTSHAAIVSRELGVPAIVGTIEATTKIKDGDLITVDASQGIVMKGSQVQTQTTPIMTQPIVKKDYTAPVTGTKIYMNLGIPEKINEYANLPVDGIGLMRIEFIIASKIKKHPVAAIKEGQSENFVNMLAEGISKVASTVRPRPVIVRFSDFKTNEYADLEGGADYEPKENNPMLGWRGASRYVSPEFEQAFRLECKAIKKVRDSGLNNVWVMLPFVRTIKEVKQIEQIMNSEGLNRTNDFKMYVMAEIPSNIILAEEFSKACDGFSIGSNDLTQLTLGVDRDSAMLGRMGYFDERNEAVMKSIKQLIERAHENGITVSICGQAPSQYPEFTEFLVRNGIDSISVNPDVIYQTRDLVYSVERRILLKEAREEKKEEWKPPQQESTTETATEWVKDQIEEETTTENPPFPGFGSTKQEEPEESNDPRDHEDKGMFWP